MNVADLIMPTLVVIIVGACFTVWLKWSIEGAEQRLLDEIRKLRKDGLIGGDDK